MRYRKAHCVVLGNPAFKGCAGFRNQPDRLPLKAAPFLIGQEIYILLFEAVLPISSFSMSKI